MVVSPRNYFLFTPLLPSCTVGTIELRSIMEPIRFITQHKSRNVRFYESECTDIDPESKTISISGMSQQFICLCLLAVHFKLRDEMFITASSRHEL